MARNEEVAVGIDLGTTYSVVGFFKKGKVEIIANDAGSRTTPSYVHFSDSSSVVGEGAKETLSSNTVFDSKRMIGRNYNDEAIEKNKKTWPFTVINDGGVPKYEIERNGLTNVHSPEEVSGLILLSMKETAEAYLMADVKKAVITVPAYFNENQRQATKDAANIAGLEVIALLNEPTAAALNYGYEKSGNGETVLIFDFGGGTFDISILRLDNNRKFQVLATGGDPQLGGQDLDRMLLEFIIKDIKEKHKVDVSQDPQALHELRIACELAKRKLSTRPETSIKTCLARQQIMYEKSISRAFFEDLVAELLRRTVDLIPGVLKTAKMSEGDIDDVLLVGGSTRIPKVREFVSAFFGGKELKHGVNPDEAVAVGAAIHAASLTGQKGASGIKLKDVTSLSLGVATHNGLMAVLVPRNAPLPTSVTKTFTTAHDDQEEAEFKIYQGERARWEDNSCLGSCSLSLPPQPKGSVDMKVTYSLDESGILTVTAFEETTGEEATVTIESENRLSHQDMKLALAEAEKYREQDRKERESAWRARFNE